MNVNLLIMVIILYILKNNSCQYWYAQNKNQNLLLLLLFINERNQCLNNKYNYMNLSNNKNRYYMNYPNHALDNSNCIKDTSKDTSINNDKGDAISKDTNSPIDTNKNNNDENITINNNKGNLINSNKNITKNTIKDNIVNTDNDIIINTNTDITIKSNKDNSISNNKNRYYINYPNYALDNSNCIKNTSKDTSINNDKGGTINKNNDSSIDTNKNNNDENITKNNNKNSNRAILKNKFIKAATKIHNKSLTYKKNHRININNTFKQLTLAKEIIDINKFTNNFNLKTPAPLTDLKAKVPVLVGSTNITEVFHGNVTFCTPIISILKVTNEIFITSKNISPTLHSNNNNNNNNAVLHYEGFLKTQLDYLESVIIEQSQIKCDSKHYIMFIPFLGSKDLNLTDEIINSSNIILQDFTLDINKSTFSVATCLEEPAKGNKYVNLYKICNLTVKVDCNVSLYRKKLVHL